MNVGKGTKTLRGWTAIVALASGTALVACAATSQTPTAEAPPSGSTEQQSASIGSRAFQTIVRLKDTSADVRSQEMLGQLGRIARARVEYVRPMSGDAHVVRVVPEPPTTYELALQRLRDSGLLEYVEHDALMQPMTGR